MYCEYSEYIKKGLEQYLWCTLINDYCTFQRYCTNKLCVVQTEKWELCKARSDKNEIR